MFYEEIIKKFAGGAVMKTEKRKGRPAAKLIAIILVAAMVLSIIVPLAGSVAFGAAYMTTSAEVAVDGTGEAGQAKW